MRVYPHKDVSGWLLRGDAEKLLISIDCIMYPARQTVLPSASRCNDRNLHQGVNMEQPVEPWAKSPFISPCLPLSSTHDPNKQQDPPARRGWLVGCATGQVISDKHGNGTETQRTTYTIIEALNSERHNTMTGRLDLVCCERWVSKRLIGSQRPAARNRGEPRDRR